jgi:hypothetical protein
VSVLGREREIFTGRESSNEYRKKDIINNLALIFNQIKGKISDDVYIVHLET